MVTELLDLWPQNSRHGVNPSGYKFWGTIQQRIYQTTVLDASDLTQRLIDVWAGVEQSVIDDAIDQWHMPAEPQEDILNIRSDKY